MTRYDYVHALFSFAVRLWLGLCAVRATCSNTLSPQTNYPQPIWPNEGVLMPYEWPHEVMSYSNLSIGLSSAMKYPPLEALLQSSKVEVRGLNELCLAAAAAAAASQRPRWTLNRRDLPSRQ